jgi:hypothetical protein
LLIYIEYEKYCKKSVWHFITLLFQNVIDIFKKKLYLIVQYGNIFNTYIHKIKMFRVAETCVEN